MVTRSQQELARARGAAADALLEQLLLGQQQPQQQQAENNENQPPSPPQPPHPSQATHDTANLFAAAFGGENQAPAAVQHSTAVHGRTGQHAGHHVTADGRAQRIVTDAHAQVVRPNPAMVAGQRRVRRRRSRSTGPRASATAAACARADEGDLPQDLPQDVMDDILREQAAAAPLLMNDEAIDQDIRHVMRSRVAAGSRKKYNDYMTRFIMFLYDHEEKFPDLIPPEFMSELVLAAQQDLVNTTRAGLPKKNRSYPTLTDCY